MWDNRNYILHYCSTPAKRKKEDKVDKEIKLEYWLGTG